METLLVLSNGTCSRTKELSFAIVIHFHGTSVSLGGCRDLLGRNLIPIHHVCGFIDLHHGSAAACEFDIGAKQRVGDQRGLHVGLDIRRVDRWNQ
ncbi:MAG: hypothetical protein ACI9DF_001525 [Verrucomicrobiales bacterium]|jgi:hypothetical protein